MSRQAKKGDVLEVGYTVVEILGSGATAKALLVRQELGDTTRELVLTGGSR
jgi:hypothetical protein